MTENGKIRTPIKAIRAYCIECSGGMAKEVRLCNMVNCPLFPYRMGKRPTVDAEVDKDNKSEKNGS